MKKLLSSFKAKIVFFILIAVVLAAAIYFGVKLNHITNIQKKLEIGASVENESYYYELNIKFDISKYINTPEFLLEEADGFDEIIDTISKVDDSFDEKGYKVSCYDVLGWEGNSGMVYLIYYIENQIETNKIYELVVKRGKVIGLIFAYKPFPEDRPNLESSLIEKVELFEASFIPEEIDMSSVIEVKEGYFYDYETVELRYMRTVYKGGGGFNSEKIDDVIIE